MMVVDFEITLAGHLQVEESMPREEVEHVVEEADPGADRTRSTSVKVECDVDRGLPRLAFNFSVTFHYFQVF
jgi:hypothetical protein